MNFLDLCRRASREAGLSGDGPSSVTGQAGEMKRVVDAVNDAWVEIQSRCQHWAFMQSTDTVTATSGQVQIEGMQTPLRVYRETSGVRSELYKLSQVEYDRLGARSGIPSRYYHQSGDTLVLWPAPGDPVDVFVRYVRKPVAMLNNGDAPTLPEQFHMMIVWLAVKSLAAFDEAGNYYQNAVNEYRKLYHRAAIDQTPDPELAEASW